MYIVHQGEIFFSHLSKMLHTLLYATTIHQVCTLSETTWWLVCNVSDSVACGEKQMNLIAWGPRFRLKYAFSWAAMYSTHGSDDSWDSVIKRPRQWQALVPVLVLFWGISRCLGWLQLGLTDRIGSAAFQAYVKMQLCSQKACHNPPYVRHSMLCNEQKKKNVMLMTVAKTKQKTVKSSIHWGKHRGDHNPATGFKWIM